MKCGFLSIVLKRKVPNTRGTKKNSKVRSYARNWEHPIKYPTLVIPVIYMKAGGLQNSLFRTSSGYYVLSTFLRAVLLGNRQESASTMVAIHASNHCLEVLLVSAAMHHPLINNIVLPLSSYLEMTSFQGKEYSIILQREVSLITCLIVDLK